MPNEFWVMCWNSVFTGIGFCHSQVLFAPLMKARMTLKYRIIEGSDEELEKRLNDLNSLLFLFSQTIGALVGPMVGAGMNMWKGHRKACDTYSIIFLCLAIVMTPFYMTCHPYKIDEEEKF